MGGLLFLLFLVPSAVFGAPQKWDLKAVYENALTKTETVATQNAITEQAREREWQATGLLFPNINLVGAYLRQDPGSSGTAFAREEQTTARIALIQPLFRGFGEFAERRSRLALVRAQEKQTEQTRLTLFESVARAYYDLLAAQKDYETLNEMKDISDKRVKELTSQVRIGRSRAGDKLSAEAQSATLEAQIAGAVTTRDQAWEAFRFTTGLSEQVELNEPSEEIPEKIPALDTWLARIPNRPDLQSQQALVESSDEAVAVARAGHFPSLDLAANYYLRRAGILADSKWDVTLNLVLPLFQGGTIQARVSENVERRKQTELQLATARRNAERQIRSLHQELMGHLQQHLALHKAVDLAERNFAQQSKDYRYGLATHLEVIQATNSLQETKRLHDRNRYAAHAALAALKSAVGEI